MGLTEVIVDASAVLAILLREDEEQVFSDFLMEHRGRTAISPVNYVEVGLRVDRPDMATHSEKVDRVLEQLNVTIASLGPEEARLAREAYRKFGKGNHPARLNLGDCFAYALSKARGGPLLFKGNDFSQTDVEPAL